MVKMTNGLKEPNSIKKLKMQMNMKQYILTIYNILMKIKKNIIK